MNNRRVICFSCINEYHIFITYILTKIFYKDDYIIILISDYHSNLIKIYERLKTSSHVWQEVFLIKEESGTAQLSTINLKNVDILHYYTYALFNYNLLNFITKDTKVILTSDGIMTYIFSESFKVNNVSPIDLLKINEIWVFDKDLYISKLDRPVKEIPMNIILEDSLLLIEICKELNELFEYNHKNINSDIIFFDQSLSKSRIVLNTYEGELLNEILMTLNQYNMLIKIHPSDTADKYTCFNENIFNYINIPWELVLFNEIISNRDYLKEKVYISYNSAAIFNTKKILDYCNINSHYIFLNELIKRYRTNNSIFLIRQCISKFIEKYYENIYIIGSISELDRLLNNIVKEDMK